MIKLDIDKNCIYPLCFYLSEVSEENKLCNKCYSEAVSVELVSLKHFLNSTNESKLYEIEATFLANRVKYNQVYFRTKLARLKRVIDIKKYYTKTKNLQYKETIFKYIIYRLKTLDG